MHAVYLPSLTASLITSLIPVFYSYLPYDSSPISCPSSLVSQESLEFARAISILTPSLIPSLIRSLIPCYHHILVSCPSSLVSQESLEFARAIPDPEGRIARDTAVPDKYYLEALGSAR